VNSIRIVALVPPGKSGRAIGFSQRRRRGRKRTTLGRSGLGSSNRGQPSCCSSWSVSSSWSYSGRQCTAYAMTGSRTTTRCMSRNRRQPSRGGNNLIPGGRYRVTRVAVAGTLQIARCQCKCGGSTTGGASWAWFGADGSSGGIGCRSQQPKTSSRRTSRPAKSIASAS
jgi:hypothetical protein